VAEDILLKRYQRH